MPGERMFFGTPKSESQLEDQVAKAQEHIGSAPEHTLIPPHVEREEILKMPVAELRERFGRRYEMYIEMLRRGTSNDFVNREELLARIRSWLAALNSLDAYIERHDAGHEVVLRGKQIDVFHKLRDFLEAGDTAGYVKLPTGYGKTVLFVELVEALDLKTLIVVPTNILVDQTGDKISTFAPDLDMGRIDKVAKEYGRKVTVTTYASLLKQIANGQINPREFECVILDESHEATSEARETAITRFDNAVKLGFSATPRASELLPKEIYSVPLREAIEEGGLSSVSVVIARTQTDLSKVKLNKDGEYSEKELEVAVNIAARNKAAVELYKQAFDGELTVAYCVGIAHAEALALEFRSNDVAVEAISSKTSREEQKRLFEEFHEGKIKVLCNADLLIQGYDEARASVCFNLRPTRSRIYAEQRGGRVLRLDSENPNKHATVVEFLDNVEEAAVPPVLFSHILGGAYVGLVGGSKKTWGRGGSDEDGKNGLPILSIPGLEVIFDADEVMRIDRLISEKFSSNKVELIRDLETLKAAVRAVGILSARDYKNKCKEYPEWPSNPDQILPGWVGWPDLFGKKRVELIKDIEILKAVVRTAGISGKDDYDNKRKEHPEWPSTPYKLPGWISWPDFTGKNQVELIKDLKTLKAAVLAADVSGKIDYLDKRKEHPEWPSHPFELPGWISWPDLFGKKRVELIKDIKTLKAAVRAAGVIGYDDYLDKRKEHPEWPSNPNQVLPGWVGLPDLFGKKRVELIKDIEILKAVVRTAGISGKDDYDNKRKEHPEWPSQPHKLPGWVNWRDFLGKK